MWSCSFKMLVQLIESFQRESMIVNAAKVLLPLQIVLCHKEVCFDNYMAPDSNLDLDVS